MNAHPTISKMDDEELAKELSFAEGFALTDPDGERWLALLQEEDRRRKESARRVITDINIESWGPVNDPPWEDAAQRVEP